MYLPLHSWLSMSAYKTSSVFYFHLYFFRHFLLKFRYFLYLCPKICNKQCRTLKTRTRNRQKRNKRNGSHSRTRCRTSEKGLKTNILLTQAKFALQISLRWLHALFVFKNRNETYEIKIISIIIYFFTNI